jgi:hypothetical protein
MKNNKLWLAVAIAAIVAAALFAVVAGVRLP